MRALPDATRRAGIGQIFRNDVDDAIADATWIKEHGLRGGVLISAVPPDVDCVKRFYDLVYDPLWKACEELGLPVNSHNTGATGELRYGEEHKLPKLASEYFAQNCYVGVSQTGPEDAQARYSLGIDKFMWGSDYPHDEGTFPFTREHLRQLFHDTPRDELQMLLARTAATLYAFDLAALAPLAVHIGPTVSEIAKTLERLPNAPNEALLKTVGAVR